MVSKLHTHTCRKMPTHTDYSRKTLLLISERLDLTSGTCRSAEHTHTALKRNNLTSESWSLLKPTEIWKTWRVEEGRGLKIGKRGEKMQMEWVNIRWERRGHWKVWDLCCVSTFMYWETYCCKTCSAWAGETFLSSIRRDCLKVKNKHIEIYFK